MQKVTFHQVIALPPANQIQADAFYYVLNGDKASAYLSDSYRNVKTIVDDAMIQALIDASGGGGGTSDHSALQNLDADTHAQYHNDTRGDVRYYQKSEIDTALNGYSASTHTHDLSDLTDVTLPSTPLDGQAIAWNSSSNQWEAQTVSAGGETNSTVKTKYEANANTNAFEDAEKTKLGTVETGAQANVNPDWNGSGDNTEILNKPTIPTSLDVLTGTSDDIAEGATNKYFLAAERTKLTGIANNADDNVQSDWNAASGDAQILNKPPIPVSLTDLSGNSDNVTQGSTNLFLTTAERAKIAATDETAEPNVLADWNGSGDDSEILNKPTIPSALASLSGNSDNVAEGSTNLYLSGKRSIEVDAGDAQLSGDVDAPGNDKVYGTNSSGVRGWKDDPAAGGGEANVNADWNAVSGDEQILNKPTIPAALTDLSGDSDNVTQGSANLFMTAAERTKLGTIESGAKDNQSAAEIATAYHTVSNEFTTAEQSKLSAIETALNADVIAGTDTTKYVTSAGIHAYVNTLATVEDDAYAANWAGDTDAPSKGAMYNKLESGGFTLMYGVNRWNALTTNDWITNSDNQYGGNLQNADETGGTGATPVANAGSGQHFLGRIVKSGSRINDIIIDGHTNSNAEVTDFDISLMVYTPNPAAGFETGINAIGQYTATEVLRERWFDPVDAGATDFSGNTNWQHVRKFSVDYTFSADSYYVIWMRPIGTITSTKYLHISTTTEVFWKV